MLRRCVKCARHRFNVMQHAPLFAIFEITSLSKNEKVIQKVNDNQLETIVFSVNQYTDDIISSWAEKLNIFITEFSKPDDTLKTYLNRKPYLKNIILVNRGKLRVIGNELADNSKTRYIKGLILIKDNQLRKIKNYLNVNYRKNEPIGIDAEGKSLYVAFWAGSNPETAQLCIMEIDVHQFVTSILSAKLQASLENEFLIGIFNKKENNKMVYFSDYHKTIPQFNFRRNLWLFPNYEIAVQIKARTIEDSIKSRAWNNLILFFLIEVLYIVAAILIFRFTRKEMRLARLKSEFISNVSHEIRTPLALISMYIETLEMGRVKSEEKIKEYYDVILQETQRLLGIVNNILNFSKLESGKISFSFEPIAVNSLVDEVLSTYSFHLKNKDFKLNLDLDISNPSLKVDKRSMCDVLVNLLDNAVKYSAEVKEITIRTGKDQQWVFIEISDKGIGISKENQHLIFDQFFRVTQGNLAHHAKGTGLGLSIVKYIIDAHKGKVEVQSVENNGSSFKIMIPSYTEGS